MTKTLRDWLTRKWTVKPDPTLVQDYQVTFSTLHGQRVLQHLVDTIYCTVYEGHDPIEGAIHQGRRSVVHEVLQNIDYGTNPDKYTQEMVTYG